jgi:hypothetical protein
MVANSVLAKNLKPYAGAGTCSRGNEVMRMQYSPQVVHGSSRYKTIQSRARAEGFQKPCIRDHQTSSKRTFGCSLWQQCTLFRTYSDAVPSSGHYTYSDDRSDRAPYRKKEFSLRPGQASC